jgi:hypothetical protein
MYFEGRGVAQDDVLAHAWLTLAAAGGEDAALPRRAAEAQAILKDRMGAAEIASSTAQMAELRATFHSPAF